MQINQTDCRKAPASVAAFANIPVANDVEPRKLWQRYIEVTKEYCAADNSLDGLATAASKEIAELPRPWLPFPKEGIQKYDFTDTDQGMVMTQRQKVTVKRDEDEGAWLVLEFLPTRHTDMEQYSDGETRWQPYPEAETGDEAYSLATVRAVKDQRSYKAKVGAVHQRHGDKRLKALVHEGHDRAAGIIEEIAKANSTAPEMIAIKLAAGMVMDFPANFVEPDAGYIDHQAWEQAALISAYQSAVEQGGFDPMAEWRATPGI